MKWRCMKTKMILAFFSLIILGCNKATVNFHVKIINPATGEGYANHEFYIKSSKTGSDGQIVKTEYTGFTDQNGEAIVPLKIKKSVAHYVTPSVVSNTCYINSIDLYYNNTSDPNPQFIFEIAPCAQLKLNIQNVNCEGPNDHFKLIYNGRQVGGDDGLIGAVVKDEFGCYTFEQGHWSDVPMGKRYYKWEVTRSTGTTVTYDTVSLNQGEQKVYNINY